MSVDLIKLMDEAFNKHPSVKGKYDILEARLERYGFIFVFGCDPVTKNVTSNNKLGTDCA